MSQPSGSESPIPCRVPKVVGERVALQLQMADVSLDELQSYSQFLSAKFGVIVKFQNSHMVQIEGRFERLGELRKFIAQNALKKYGADGNLLKSPSSPLLNNATPQRRIPSGTTSPLVLASERNDIQLQQSFAQMNTFDRNDHCSPGLKADWLCDSPARKRKRDLNAEHNDLESIVNHDGTFLCEICNKSFWTLNHLTSHKQQKHTGKKRKPEGDYLEGSPRNVFRNVLARRATGSPDTFESKYIGHPHVHQVISDSHIRQEFLMES